LVHADISVDGNHFLLALSGITPSGRPIVHHDRFPILLPLSLVLDVLLIAARELAWEASR